MTDPKRPQGITQQPNIIVNQRAFEQRTEKWKHYTLWLENIDEKMDADSCSYETVRRLLKKHVETVAGAGMVYPGGQR